MSEPTRLRRASAIFVKAILPVLVLIGSARLAMTLIENREAPQRQERPNPGLLVEVSPVVLTPERIDVSAEGTVVAAREVVISPQVAGQVTWVSDSLTPGGIVQAGDDLIRIQDRDYQLIVEMRRAELERAEAAFSLERGRQLVAAREWEMFADELPENPDGRSLALREPQRRDAEQVVELAESLLSQARLDLRRTALTAPFNAFVQGEAVEVGQVVGLGSPVANLVGTDTYWVRVSLPLERLSHIDIPGVNATEGAPARIRFGSGGRRTEREGRVVRLLPDLDPIGRMARVLVAVDDPLRLSLPPDQRGLPLLIGSFVSVTFEGNRTEPLIEVPRVAVREGNQVFVMTPERTLDIREVEVVWGRPDTVLVRSGLADGELVVTSRVGTAIPGMALRTLEDEAPSEGTGGPQAQAPRDGEGDEQPAE